MTVAELNHHFFCYFLCCQCSSSCSLFACVCFFFRSLCVDALIELSDENTDWKLSFDEFLNCLKPGFSPPEKSELKEIYFELKSCIGISWKTLGNILRLVLLSFCGGYIVSLPSHPIYPYKSRTIFLELGSTPCATRSRNQQGVLFEVIHFLSYPLTALQFLGSWFIYQSPIFYFCV